MKIYIYALREVGQPFEAIRWIGQTCNLEKRLKSHKGCYATANNTKKISWILGANKNIEIIPLEEADENNADERESALILQFRNRGFDLLNIKPGGRTSRGYSQRPESIAKRMMSNSGKRHTQQTKELLSMINSQPDAVERMRKVGKSRKGKPSNRLGVKLSPETKKKISLNSSRHSTRKLSPKQEMEICALRGKMKSLQIAKKYSIDQSTVFEIYKRNPS